MTVAQLKMRMDHRFTILQRRMNARIHESDQRTNGGFETAARTADSRFASLERRMVSLGDKLDALDRRWHQKTDANAHRLEEKLEVFLNALHAHDWRLEDLERAGQGYPPRPSSGEHE